MSGSMMPPWLIRYQQNLEDDGIQQEEDIQFISDDLFEAWEQPLYMPNPKDDEKSIFDPENVSPISHFVKAPFPSSLSSLSPPFITCFIYLSFLGSYKRDTSLVIQKWSFLN